MPPAKTQAARRAQATCRDVTLAYPFWLAGQGQDVSSCGPPTFRLTCIDSASSGAFLSSSNMKVLIIDYGNRQPPSRCRHALMAANEACNILFNVSSAFTITDRFIISQSNRELYVLSSCKERWPLPGRCIW